MKISKIYPFLLSALFLIVVLSCTQEDRDTTFTDGIALPSNLSLLVQITQDNTGTVTLTPSGESVAQYTIDFGDNSESAMAAPGEFFTHTTKRVFIPQHLRPPILVVKRPPLLKR